MRYFHRTSVSPDDALAAAERFLGSRLAALESAPRRRVFRGTIGQITVNAEPEGGHYTLVTVATDQVGESEADKLAKRFLAMVHQRAEPRHEVRGAY